MVGSYGSISSNITSVYNTTTKMLTDALTRIASGKKFQNASEDLLGFVRSQQLTADISGYDRVRENLTQNKMYTSTAVQLGSSVYEKLEEMKQLSIQYDGTTDTDLQAQYSAEFDALVEQIDTALDNTYVEGVAIASTGLTGWGGAIDDVYLDPDGNGSLAMTISDMTTTAEVDLLDISADGSDIEAEMASVLTFMTEAKSLDAILKQQISLNETVVNSKLAVRSLITDIDEAEEMSKVLDLSLRQQASMAMFAQGNMIQSSISKLYE